MACDVGKVANVRVVEVGDLLGRRGAECDAIAIGNIDGRGLRHGCCWFLLVQAWMNGFEEGFDFENA